MRRLNVTLLGLYRYFLRKDPDKHVALFYAQCVMTTALMVGIIDAYVFLRQVLGWIEFDAFKNPRFFSLALTVFCYAIVFVTTKKTKGLEAMDADEKEVTGAFTGLIAIYVSFFVLLMYIAVAFQPWR